MNKIIIVLSMLTLSASLCATSTRITVCNSLQNNSELPAGQIEANIFAHPCTNHGGDPDGLIEVGQCKNWLIGGCNTEVDIWFPNHKVAKVYTSLVHGQYNITAQQRRTMYGDWVYEAKVDYVDTYGNWDKMGPYTAE